MHQGHLPGETKIEFYGKQEGAMYLISSVNYYEGEIRKREGGFNLRSILVMVWESGRWKRLWKNTTV